jgi:hypothetical protein
MRNRASGNREIPDRRFRAVRNDDVYIRSPLLTIFWRCDFPPISSRRALGAASRQPSVNGLGRGFASNKGLAMLIRGRMAGIEEGAALAAPDAISPAALPTLLLGGLLLLIGP